MCLCGCVRPPAAIAPPKPAEVVVEYPLVEEHFTDYEDFTGRTAAINSIDLRARVTGYLDHAYFKDGADVKQGDLLYKIDPRIYQAIVDQTVAALKQEEARNENLRKDYNRAMATKGLSQQEIDKYTGDLKTSDAAIEVAKANLKQAQQNLDFTRVTAPIDGRLSNRKADPGNLIKQDDTILNTLVTVDPIHAYFAVDSRTVLRARKLISEGKMESARVKETTVRIGLADEDGFPLTGTVNFVDNQLDPNTSTLNVRAVVNNEKQILSPGMFIRVRVPLGLPHRTILIPEEAIGTDQGQKFVYVVNDNDEVEYREIKPGRQFNEKLRVLEPDETSGGKRIGVGEGERIIVSGLQRVRPKAKVTPITHNNEEKEPAKDQRKEKDQPKEKDQAKVKVQVKGQAKENN